MPSRSSATHRSATLVDVLSASMKYSNNFTTEQVLRTLGLACDAASPEASRRASQLLERFSQSGQRRSRTKTQLVNGSGLTHQGRRLPSPPRRPALALVGAPRFAQRRPCMASYARAGGEGTLHYRNAFAGSRVRAKTGTLAGVSALSGVVYSERRLSVASPSPSWSTAPTPPMSRAMQDHAVQAELLRVDRRRSPERACDLGATLGAPAQRRAPRSSATRAHLRASHAKGSKLANRGLGYAGTSLQKLTSTRAPLDRWQVEPNAAADPHTARLIAAVF